MSNSSTSSIIKTLDKIVTNVVNKSLPTTVQTSLLYKAGSDLTATVISQISY